MRCAKLRNIAYVDFVCSGLNASWYNLHANHTAILAAEDTCLPDPTPDKVIVINVDPTVVEKRANVEEGSTNNVDDVDDQDDAHYHFADNVNDLSFDLVRSSDLVLSFDRRTKKRVDPFVFLLSHVLPTDPDHVVEDDLAQGAEGLGLMQNEDHQVIGNEQKLKEDAPNCTRVDDDGVEFSPRGGDYFPTMGDKIKKDKLLHLSPAPYYMPHPYVDGESVEIFEDLTVCEDALDHSLSSAEILKIETMSPLEPLNQWAGLDEPEHDLSFEESLTHECKDVIVDNEQETLHRRTITLDDSERAISYIGITCYFGQLRRRTIILDDSGQYDMGFAGGSIPSSFRWHASIGAPESLLWNLHVKVSKEYLFPYLADHCRLGCRVPRMAPNIEAYLRRPLGLGKRASNIRIIWFSFGSFEDGSFRGVSFGSSAESKSVV
nr:hypothetical protein [Tanacetum cinerariifolium]